VAVIAVLGILAACPRSITDNGYVLTVAPAAANVFIDDSLRLTATLVDHSGAVVSTPMSWSVDNPSVASVDTTGTVHGHASGSATISVSAKGQTASASVVVVVDSGQTLSVAPNAARLYVSSSQQFTATLKDRNGKTLPSAVQWESNNTAVATVDANGLVRGVSTGTASIQAKVHNLVAAAPVTVAPMPASVVLVGAGDIASCTLSADEATAKLLDAIDGTVFTAGDNAYENGSASDFSQCYGPTWGRHKSRTRPAIGNHEYNTIGASGYFDYFGGAAGDGNKGYYSYELGAWHIIVLNSNVAMNAGSPEETWLRADLAAHPARCTLAIWHHPRFSSGHHGSSASSQPLWQALYDAGADLVIVGHDHLYERFKPQTATGQVDMARGIREFVVGTGGAGLYAFEHPAPNSEVKDNQTHGVLKLTLYGDRYDWKFVPVAGSSFTDSGTGNCH
jgi:uncharacterized protein YjdB